MPPAMSASARISPGEPRHVPLQAQAATICGAIEIATAELDVAQDVVRDLATLLSAQEAARAERFYRPRDRDRFIVARARLRQLIAERLDVLPESLEFSYGPHGKPALAGAPADSGLCFNLSHSEALAVYAFTAGREVGVDVEAVRVLQDADDIATRFFSRREVAAYLALAPRDRPLGFFNCWTRKEAFIKAIGEGLSHPLDRFDVTLAPGEQARFLRVAELPGETCGWALHSLSPAPGFVAALVVRDDGAAHAASADQWSRATS